ncbi:hypothetical protein [Caballeronia sp. LZ019]|uniref:hypothetical protein n=1 Tax=Caballeronia sp. LZ019 TaxID=3038555 RepID=UPI0028648F8A|nr:hypothetical protein [Caballeronia sp. LZ019]MDR5809100.1 hypothetical protein [Caballeronia sp. LZ019]
MQELLKGKLAAVGSGNDQFFADRKSLTGISGPMTQVRRCDAIAGVNQTNKSGRDVGDAAAAD